MFLSMPCTSRDFDLLAWLEPPDNDLSSHHEISYTIPPYMPYMKVVRHLPILISCDTRLILLLRYSVYIFSSGCEGQDSNLRTLRRWGYEPRCFDHLHTSHNMLLGVVSGI